MVPSVVWHATCTICVFCFFPLVTSILVALMLLQSPALINGKFVVYVLLDIKCWGFLACNKSTKIYCRIPHIFIV